MRAFAAALIMTAGGIVLMPLFIVLIDQLIVMVR